MKRVLPCVALCVLIGLVYQAGGLEFIERRLMDARFGLDARPATGELTLITIDSKSLRALNVWPWPRGYHATVIENLLEAGARRVAFDVDFSSRSIVEEDRQLTATLAAANGRVILPVFRQWEHDESGTPELVVTEPLRAFRPHATLATINLKPDSDGLTRRYGEPYSVDGVPTFAASLIGSEPGTLQSFYIDFGIDPETIPRISYVDVLSGRFDPARVANRVIVVGGTAVELGDQFAVPRYAAVPGPVIQALAFESLAQGRALRLVGPVATLGVALILALLIGPLMVDWSWRRGLLVVAVFTGALWGGSVIVQRVSPWMLEVAPWMLVLVACYGWSLVSRLESQALRLLIQRRRIRRTESLMNHVVENSFDAILTLDRYGRVQSFNRAAQGMFGYTEKDGVGRDAGELVLIPEAGERGASPVAFADGLHGLREAIGQRADGGEFPIEVAVTTMLVDGTTKRVIFARDISVRKAQQRALQHQAMHDALTELPNRYLLRERMEQALEVARADRGVLAFMILDLDRFKEINDTLGHHTGDRLLRSIATRLRTALRPSDTIARFGGDEFAALLPSADPEAALQVARRLVRVLQTPFRLESLSLQVDTSVGIAMFPEHGKDVATLVQRADVAMYVAKRSRSGVELYDENHDYTSLRQLTLSGELRSAIESRSLTLEYQPKVAADSDCIAGVEALLRWRHSEFGNVPPDEFITLAEQSGMIRQLTHLVFATALRQCAEWNRNGMPLEISVNVSAHNLLDEDLPQHLERLLRESAVPPEQLTLEITESVIMEDPQRAMNVATQLRTLGVNIAIDDFGIGYSSLGYLKKLPARELKIDKSFVMEMDRNLDDATIVRSTIELAHNLGLRVVAEGVERREIWQALKELGCDVGQGYLFSHPLPAEELTCFVRERQEHVWAEARVRASPRLG
jgi:diguanylate cyclase (GGDEF)-like protein/PAS domain S-box-containing protein